MRDLELELENDSEYEYENQSEPFLGDVMKGVGGLLGLGESEGLGEFEGFLEGEGAFGEGPLGEYEGVHESLREGPLGEFENEQFLQGESEFEGLGEFEGEQFFGKAFKKIGGFIKKAAPILKSVARVAAPLVGTAVGGPLGGALGSMAGKLLGESELEGEFELEMESESEAEMEAALRAPLTEHQALGELMAAAASRAVTDMEAEAQIGSSIAISLSAADRNALRAVLPSLNRGVAVLTRILRRRPATRPAVRVIPAIIKRSAVTLRKQAAAGQPITRQTAARAVAKQTRRVLGTPSVCARAIQRNVSATRAVARNARTSQQQRYAI
jgi:hypothetical protein